MGSLYILFSWLFLQFSDVPPQDTTIVQTYEIECLLIKQKGVKRYFLYYPASISSQPHRIFCRSTSTHHPLVLQPQIFGPCLNFGWIFFSKHGPIIMSINKNPDGSVSMTPRIGCQKKDRHRHLRTVHITVSCQTQ